jgi:HEAT repeat protein
MRTRRLSSSRFTSELSNLARVIDTGAAPPRVVLLAMLLGALCQAAGCMPQLRRPLPPDDAQSFHGAALQLLKQDATGEQPLLRMQAIEAFQDVAPAEGLPYIVDSIDNGYAGISFAALMAIGSMREGRFIDKVRVRAEDSDPNVRIAALFALHRLGDAKRTGEIGELLLDHADARVRANAALAVGRLGEKGAVKLLRTAGQREKKDAVKLQIREALAILNDQKATEELIFAGHSAVPDQATLALMFLANAKSPQADELFRYRLYHADQPEIKLQAARGLGLLGSDQGYDIACAHLYYRASSGNRKNDPPEQQIARVRALAALALEAIGDADALGPLKDAFYAEGQAGTVRLAVARAAIGIMNRASGNNPAK